MKIKRVIEIEESDLERIRDIVERENKTALSVTTRGTAYITIADSKPYDTSGDCISREGIRKALNEAFDCEDATKYGNKNAEQQYKSYSTLMLYEIADIVEDCCDNAPTVHTKNDCIMKKCTICPHCDNCDVDENGEVHNERPQGEWYYSCDKGWECNQCHEIVKDMPTCMRKALYNFCPNCGADMRKGGAE